MVCSNLCFSGSEAMVTRKHTNGINLDDTIPMIYNCLEDRYEMLEESIEELKNKSIRISTANDMMVNAARAGSINSSDIIPILDEYINPRHEEFRAKNQWNLYNAATEIIKKYTPARADKCYRGLATQFNLN